MLELWYNGVALHQLGTVRVASESSAPTPDAAAPQAWLVSLRVTVDFLRGNYVDNQLLYRQAREAVKTPHGTLRWADVQTTSAGTEVATNWVEVPARVTSEDFPEDPNAWGTYRQRIEVGFEYEEEISQAHLATATYLKTGGAGPAITLGHVASFKEGYTAARFNSTTSPRSRVGGTVSASGQFKSDPTLAIADRRTALLALKEAWLAELQGSSGRLVFGSAFDKTVRMDDFSCDLNQHLDAIDWSFSASYTRFPDESNYAVCEFKAAVREAYEEGYSYLTLSGSIGAPSSTVAEAKLRLVRSSVLASYGFASANKLEGSTDHEQVSVSPPSGGDSTNTDGDAYLRLSFSEQYRKRSADILSYSLKIADADDTRTGLTRTTYTGHVMASGYTSAAAYEQAKAWAQSLGSGKYQIQLGSSLSAEYERKGATGTGAEEFVRLEFSYEYQRKAVSRAYVELSTATQAAALGRCLYRVSGFVVAASAAAAQEVYEQKVRALYTSSAILSEQTSVSQIKLEKASGISLGSQETLDSDGLYVTQALRLDYDLSVHKAKTAAEMGMRYATEVDTDYLARERVTTLSGTIYAPDAATAASWLDTYLVYDAALKKYRWGGVSGEVMGTRLRSRRSQGFEVVPKGNPALGTSTVLDEYSFSESFKDTITGDDTILATELSESIQFAGTRWVTQSVLDGASVVQNTGLAEGNRTVRGRVVALSESAGLSWVRRQLNLPFPAWGNAAPGTRYASAPQIETAFKLVEVLDSVGRAGDYGTGYGTLSAVGLSAVEVTFSRSEILPGYLFNA